MTEKIEVLVELPENVLAIIKEEAEDSGDNITGAVNAAFNRVKRLNNYHAFVESLVRIALQKKINDSRSTSNRRYKKSMGLYGGPAKVKVGISKTVNDAAESAYNYFIGNSTLGDLYGRDLPALAKEYRSKANGTMVDACVLEKLIPMVKDDERVRDVVSERELNRLFQKVTKKVFRTTAAV